MNIDHPYIFNIVLSYYCASNQDKIVNFCWMLIAILIYMGTMKQIRLVKIKIPSTDLKYFIKMYIISLWQIFWDFCDTSILYSIQNKVNMPYNFNLKRSDQVIISRIRISYS